MIVHYSRTKQWPNYAGPLEASHFKLRLSLHEKKIKLSRVELLIELNKNGQRKFHLCTTPAM